VADWLAEILREADAAAGAGPAGDAGLGARVRRGVVRRLRVRRIGMATVLIGLVGVGVVRSRQETMPSAVVVVSMKQAGADEQLAAIRREIEMREREIEAMILDERVSEAEAEVAYQEVVREMPGVSADWVRKRLEEIWKDG
jgi:hypothetical protein